MSEAQAEPQESLFRPSKRRKLIRRKQDDVISDDNSPLQTPPAGQLDNAGDLNEEVTEQGEGNEQPLRQRKPIGTKRGGIAFSSSAIQRNPSYQQDSSNDGQALVPVKNATDMASSRFMAPTGQITSTDDKHMMAYIDSKLASIRSSKPRVSGTSAGESQHSVQAIPGLANLDSSTTSRNITPAEETPQQRPASEDPTPSTTKTTPRIQAIPKPPRLGRDGKPLRPRKDRALRSSFDMARDAMVEQVLRESRLDIYEEPKSQVANTGGAAAAMNAGEDEEADARMADEFRRNFIAAMQERTQRRPPQPPPGGKNEVAKGPKLGGSRQQRAAMRALEEKGGAKGKK